MSEIGDTTLGRPCGSCGGRGGVHMPTCYFALPRPTDYDRRRAAELVALAAPGSLHAMHQAETAIAHALAEAREAGRREAKL